MHNRNIGTKIVMAVLVVTLAFIVPGDILPGLIYAQENSASEQGAEIDGDVGTAGGAGQGAEVTTADREERAAENTPDGAVGDTPDGAAKDTPDGAVENTPDGAAENTLSEVAENASYETAETAANETTDENVRETVDTLLAAGQYEEGQALVLYDRFAGDTGEKTVAASAGTPSSVLSGALVVNTVSAESYVKATGDTVEPAVADEELVGDSGDGSSADSCACESEERISILFVEDGEKTTGELLTEILQEPGVLCAHPNYICRIDGAETDGVRNAGSLQNSDIPDLTDFQWEYAGSSLVPVTDRDPSTLYNVHSPGWNEPGGTNADGVVVVIDSGVDYNHPDLRDAMYEFSPELQRELGCGKYGINVSGSGDNTDPMDIVGHGTHCAGIIAGSWDGSGISGLASGCRIAAVRIMNDAGYLTNLAIIQGMKFAEQAADRGVDIRVTGNSYSGTVSCPAVSTEIAELEKRGIVCVYSAGNDSASNDLGDSTGNQLFRASNTVVVDAATPTFEKADFSSYGEGTTDVFAPGTGILSSVAVEGPEESKTYFGSRDPSAFYFNTEFDTQPSLFTAPDCPVKMSCSRASGPYSYDADGKALQITLDEAEEDTYAFTFAVDIPIGQNEQADYSSMAFYAPDDRYTFNIYREGTKKDGQAARVSSQNVTVQGTWTVVSVSGLASKVAEGDAFPVISSDGGQNYIRVFADISRSETGFKKGDRIYLDWIGAGSNADALLPYAYRDGTSMACPHVSAEAAILYKGRDRSETNAAEVVSEIKSGVTEAEGLRECSSHGAIDLAVGRTAYSPVVENAVQNREEATITVTGRYFDTTGTVSLAGTNADVVSWSGEKIVFKCPGSMRSGVQIIQVKTSAGTGAGSFLLYAPNASTDSAAPLYENEIPKIPEDIFPEDSLIMGAVGLNDYLYLTVSTEFDYDNDLVTKLIRYSVKNRTWEPVSQLPEKMYGTSIIGWRGKLLLSGTCSTKDGTVRNTVYSYSPRTGGWKDLNWPLCSNTTLINFNGTVYSIGGRISGTDGQGDTASTEISRLDPSAKTQSAVADLNTGLAGPYAATDGSSIYVSGGSTITGGKSEVSRDLLQKTDFSSDGTASVSDLYPYEYPAQIPYPRYEVIAGYRKVYLVGYGGGLVTEDEESGDSGDSADKNYGVGTYVDSSGMSVLDADTYILTDDSYRPYRRRLSHGTVYKLIPAEYKGKLYAFGFSSYEGDNYLNLFGRETAAGKNEAPVWDTFTIGIPGAVTGLVYDGKKKTGVAASPEGYYSVTGNKGTEAGTYTAVLKLTDPDRCVWEDGSIEDKTITWKISAAPTVTAQPSVTGSPTVTLTPKPTGGNDTSDSSSDSKAPTSVKTGDMSQPVLWLLTGLAATAIIAAVAGKRRIQ